MSRKPSKAKSKAKSKKVGGAYLDPSMEEVQAFLDGQVKEESEYDMNDSEEFADSLAMVSVSLNGHAASPNTVAGTNYGGYFNGGGNSTQVWSGHSSSHCRHEGDKVVFEFMGKQLFAASWQGLDEYSDEWDLIIDLAGNVKPKEDNSVPFVKIRSTAPFAKDLERFVTKPKPREIVAQLLSLDWPDMGIAPVGLDFWLELWQQLPEKTVIACMGGHGRTGTCLAALMISTGVSYEEAVDQVHNRHCKRAIESIEQEKYLHRLHVEFLKRELQRATEQGEPAKVLADIQEDIDYALMNPPTVAPVKSYEPHVHTPAATKTLDNSAWMGEVIATRLAADGCLEQQRCVDTHCGKLRCEDPSHLKWILAPPEKKK